MTRFEIVAVTAQATFGRDGAMFERLLGFVAQLSGVLWGLVILTAVIRFVGIRIYRSRAAATPLIETAATTMPSTAVPATTRPSANVAEKEAVRVPAVFISAELVDVLTTDAGTNGTFNEVLQPAGAPAAVAASAKLPRRAARNRHAAPRSAAHVPALASNSTEA